MSELWHLRPELEFTHHIDSWNVRESASLTAKVVTVLRAGDVFHVTSQASSGKWLQVRLDSGVEGWCFTKLGDEDALEPCNEDGKPLVQCETQGPGMQKTMSMKERRSSLLDELKELRESLDALSGAQDEEGNHERVRAASAVEAAMRKLELLGVDAESVLSAEGLDGLTDVGRVVEDLNDEITRGKSFHHADFDNPEATSCWLSTFFQSLWHSRVFHATFDSLVRPLPPDAGGDMTRALRETWELYEASAALHKAVPVGNLVRAWGEGYGDCAEAFGKMAEDDALRPVVEQFKLVPVMHTGSTLPPTELWKQVCDQGAQLSPLVAVELLLPPLDSSSILTLSLALVPRLRRDDKARGLTELPADLGESHRLVAMICFMESFSHYVVFCRRVSEKNNWMFFNDIPGLTSGAMRELPGWAAVSHECARLQLLPKVLLYESQVCAQQNVQARANSPDFWAATKLLSRGPWKLFTTKQAAPWTSYAQLIGVGAVLVLIVALIIQQVTLIFSSMH
eukprot:TRINITY_DN9653_c0_g1_i1.p1 TRINITY_DN9653_c0_g1~~TRINITY_DN9653_c0_g1_i1.p1  ORF type:complete len:511 (+),score=83.62 TRINITY_DN9653_c0_g1_i1:96-1628(+)